MPSLGHRTARVVASFPVLLLLLLLAFGAAPARADFGVSSFTTTASSNQAGAHADLTTNITFKTHYDPELKYQVTDGDVRDIMLTLPKGLVGNPQAVPSCGPQLFLEVPSNEGILHNLCPPATVVGEAVINGVLLAPIVNLTPAPDEPALLGIMLNALPHSLIHVGSLAGANYQLQALTPGVSRATYVVTVEATLWATPHDPAHTAYIRSGDAQERKAGWDSYTPEPNPLPFMTNPTDCADTPTTTLQVDSYAEPGRFLTYTATAPNPTGCSQVPFHPSIAVSPDSSQADAPSGYTVNLGVPQAFSDPNGIESSHLRKAVVRLPLGVSISPSAANGLQACTDAQFGAGSNTPASCPDASVIGTTSVQTPLEAKPLTGYMYVGSQPPGPPTNVYRVFQEIKGYGLDIKLEGSAVADPVTGQITATFDNLPQLPFSLFTLHLTGGPNAALANPQTCGAAATTTALAPWSGQPEANPASTFNVDFDGSGGACPASLPFQLGFSAGMSSAQAGGTGTFNLEFTRGDRNQYVSQLSSVQLPPGLLGNVASVALCGSAQAAAGTCGPASQIGRVTVGAGPGPNPFYLAGNVYLTEGYAGGSFGLSVVVPVIAGPFNLGTVVVRAGIFVHNDGSIGVLTDPLPTILQGVPVRLRDVRVTLDRPGFMLNPTNCTPQSIGVTAVSVGGASANLSAPFQAGGCASLPFDPAFTVSTSAHTSKANGASLTIKVTQKPGEANIHKVDLQLPKVLPSRLSTLQKACTEAQFNANPAGCPAGSVIGTAKAVTPILNAPLTGPALLVSHGAAAFPDVEFVLQGQGVTIVLDGKTDIKKGITYSRFETVPDAPISSFETVLPEGPYSILAAYLPAKANGSLCSTSLVAPTTIMSQSGVQIRESTPVKVTGCGQKISISKRKLTGNSVSVTVSTTAKGLVTITGTGLRKTSKTSGPGPHTIRVPLTAKGRSARKHRRKISIHASLRVGEKTVAAKAASLKL